MRSRRLNDLDHRAAYPDDGGPTIAIDTAALALLFQAVGIGAHLVLSAGLDESHVPAADSWDALLAELIRCIAADGALGVAAH